MKDRNKTKNLIVEVAASIFSRFGYRKTTMDDIARTFGMRKSSLYYYFSSKEAIFEAVVIHEADLLKRDLTEMLEQTKNPKLRLKKYILVRMEALKKLSNYYNAIFSEDLAHFDFIERIREKYDKEELHTVERILIEGARQHTFRIENSELAATAICTAMKGLEVPLFWKKKNQNIENRLDDLLKILFYGIIRR